MARLKNGIFGGMQGRAGSLEGYILNGQYILRSCKTRTKKPPTEKQLAVRKKMALTNNLLNVFSSFVRVGFGPAAVGKTYNAYTAAISYQLKYPITGAYPDYVIDYSKVRVTEGFMRTENVNPAVTLRDGALHFTWTPEWNHLHSEDRSMLLAYAPALNDAVYEICGTRRSTGRDVLKLPMDWEGVTIEIYFSFISEDRTRCMNSFYLGQAIIPAL